MPLVPLYNFDHGRKTPVDLSLGRIRISISDKHCENLGFLARHSKRTFTLDDKSNRIVIEHDKKHGQVVETAELEIIDPNFTSSELFPELPDSDPAFDIALMLSFFSGRRVFTENFPEECRNTRYSSTSFEIKKVLRTSRIWERLTEIQNHNLSKAVYCIVKSYNSCDLTG